MNNNIPQFVQDAIAYGRARDEALGLNRRCPICHVGTGHFCLTDTTGTVASPRLAEKLRLRDNEGRQTSHSERVV